MKTIRKHDKGAGVEDIQQRLFTLKLLSKEAISGTFDDRTAQAVKEFCRTYDLEPIDEVTEKVWAALVDATFYLGDRTLYLRMPYYHGRDVADLQQALNALGFACGQADGIFGAYTEAALRKFQLNLGLPSDGIAGAFTYEAIHNLHHSWGDKQKSVAPSVYLGFSRAADVLENNALCLFGTNEFTRSVASRMSNLALATNPASKILSAESLFVAPNEAMLLLHIVLPEDETNPVIPRIEFEEEETLALRLKTAFSSGDKRPEKIALEVPAKVWCDAGEGRSAQHYAITLLDAVCAALAQE